MSREKVSGAVVGFKHHDIVLSCSLATGWHHCPATVPHQATIFLAANDNVDAD